MTKPTAKIEEITPAMASDILRNNDNNRNLNSNTIKQYVSYMQRGEWQLNGETIKITKAGRLLDGQHRLSAVVQYGQPQQFIVVRELDDDNMETIDVGKKRTIADALTIKGVKSAQNNVLSAAVKYVMDFEGGEYARTRSASISPTTAIKYVRKHPEIINSVNFVSAHKKGIAPITSASIASACHYLFSRKNPKKADMFIRGLAEGVGLVEGCPILALRNRLVIEVAEGKRGGENRRRHLAYFISAWRHYERGGSISHIKYNPSEPLVFNIEE